jgi:hypothetical protein
MPKYFFVTTVGTDVSDRLEFDFPTLEFAKVEARGLMMRTVMTHLETSPPDMFSVEIFNETLDPLAEMRLIYEEIDKRPTLVSASH